MLMLNPELLKDKDSIENFIHAMEADGSGNAIYNLATLRDLNNVIIPENLKNDFCSQDLALREYERAFQLFNAEADLGNAASMHSIARYYQVGMIPVTCDIKKFEEWCIKSVNAGYSFAANDLYSLYSFKGSEFFDSMKAKEMLSLLENTNNRVVPLSP